MSLVKHLNAHMVGNQTAARLAPQTIRFHIGTPGQTFAGDAAALFSAKVPKGAYEVSMTGLATDAGGTTDTLRLDTASDKKVGDPVTISKSGTRRLSNSLR